MRPKTGIIKITLLLAAICFLTWSDTYFVTHDQEPGEVGYVPPTPLVILGYPIMMLRYEAWERVEKVSPMVSDKFLFDHEVQLAWITDPLIMLALIGLFLAIRCLWRRWTTRFVTTPKP